MREKAVLQCIEDDSRIIFESNPEFLFEYQRAVLLALKEEEYLTQMQYQNAEQKLKEQCGMFVKSRFPGQS